AQQRARGLIGETNAQPSLEREHHEQRKDGDDHQRSNNEPASDPPARRGCAPLSPCSKASTVSMTAFTESLAVSARCRRTLQGRSGASSPMAHRCTSCDRLYSAP